MKAILILSICVCAVYGQQFLYDEAGLLGQQFGLPNLHHLSLSKDQTRRFNSPSIEEQLSSALTGRAKRRGGRKSRRRGRKNKQRRPRPEPISEELDHASIIASYLGDNVQVLDVTPAKDNVYGEQKRKQEKKIRLANRRRQKNKFAKLPKSLSALGAPALGGLNRQLPNNLFNLANMGSQFNNPQTNTQIFGPQHTFGSGIGQAYPTVPPPVQTPGVGYEGEANLGTNLYQRLLSENILGTDVNLELINELNKIYENSADLLKKTLAETTSDSQAALNILNRGYNKQNISTEAALELSETLNDRKIDFLANGLTNHFQNNKVFHQLQLPATDEDGKTTNGSESYYIIPISKSLIADLLKNQKLIPNKNIFKFDNPSTN